MNRHFRDAKYHLRRTVTELRRGLALAIGDVRAKVSRTEGGDEDVVDIVRARGEEARVKVTQVRVEAADRLRAIR